VCSFHVAELRIQALKLRPTCLLVPRDGTIVLLQPPCTKLEKTESVDDIERSQVPSSDVAD
jgi:hypothetical protein